MYKGFLGVLYVVSTPPLLTRKNAHDSIEWRTASTLLCHCSAGQIYIFVQCKAVFNKWLSRRRRCNRNKIHLNWSKIGIRPLKTSQVDAVCRVWGAKGVRGGTGGSQSSASCTPFSCLPYLFIPLSPDSCPSLCFSCYHVNHTVWFPILIGSALDS